jgi:predicted PurR-regulated permease PerM
MPTAPGRANTICLVILAFVAAAAALYFGAEILVPIVLAVLLAITLRPLVRGLERIGINSAAGAAIVTLGLFATFVVAGWLLVGPIAKWVQDTPRRLEAAQSKIERFRRPVQEATEVANKIAQATRGPSTAPTTAPSPPVGRASQAPSYLASVIGTTGGLLGGIVEVILLLYLLLASGDLFLKKMVKVIPHGRDRANSIKVVGEIESAVLRYLLLALMITTGQGIVVAVVLWLLQMPSPLLWGLLTMVLEFIPYLGATVMVGLLTVTALATFDGFGHAIVVPISYLVIATIQTSVISPIAYGNRLKLNPVAVLIGVLFWWFLWGVPGAFLAVPIIATLKIIADRSEGLKTLGEFLGE